MVKVNQDIIGEQYTRNDPGVLAVSDEDKKRAWKSYHEKLFNVDFGWDRNSLPYADTVSRQRHVHRAMQRQQVNEARGGY